jgi:signal transduction histidine kinase/ligand-binding sensor domain-containing protein
MASAAYALNPHKALTQYSSTVWTQEQGLPQDTIRAIAQTTDGYLWLGTDEGLARFDGYEFTIFNRAGGALPANSITALATAPDGSLWIGSAGGLTHYAANRFRTYAMKDGLPDNAVSSLLVDHAGALWIVAGGNLSHYDKGKFTNFAPGPNLPITAVRTLVEDRNNDLWVAGFTGVVKLSGGRFSPALPFSAKEGDLITDMVIDRRGVLWIAGSQGVIEISPSGKRRRYTERDGLPDDFVRALCEDRDGNLWAATNSGIARLEGSAFSAPGGTGARDRDLVRSLFEDREGDLWIGAANGLTRLRDDLFTSYGKSEGLPSDEPNAVYQDRTGRVWVGYHGSGLALFGRAPAPVALPDVEVFSMRESPSGDLLAATRRGLARMRGGRFQLYSPRDPLARNLVFDALEDSSGRLWLATTSGLSEVRNGRERNVIPGGPLLASAVVTLYAGKDGVLWAGTYGRGLWRVEGEERRLFTTADGLSSDQIRSLYQDPEGTLWIGTFAGGLNALRSGQFLRFTAENGLLSDNVANVLDDGESLWLSTTRGICRVPRRQLFDFAAGRRASLEPVNYGVEDGLRSAQCAPAYPVGAGGTRTSDGRLWFITSRGLAVFDPAARRGEVPTPLVHVSSMTAGGREVNLAEPARLDAGSSRIQIRYTAIHLSAPERVLYSHKLEGLDAEWVRAGGRRVINYNSLRHGKYRFLVRAELPGGAAAEASYSFEILPEFYETAWFRILCGAGIVAAALGIYRLRLRQIRYRFSLVLDERARLAREIHDTLAQGFVGISSQLDAVAMSMPDEDSSARKFLEMARRMARHSLTEARRSVMDLRASVLEGQDLGAALEAGARIWTAGSGVEVEVNVSGAGNVLPDKMEQHLLRIAQEAVTNALKHSGATKIRIELGAKGGNIFLRIADNGRGFEQQDAFSPAAGHFGLLGMRERAERLRGRLRLASHPGEGTEVEVIAPLP